MKKNIDVSDRSYLLLDKQKDNAVHHNYVSPFIKQAYKPSTKRTDGWGGEGGRNLCTPANTQKAVTIYVFIQRDFRYSLYHE